MCSGVGANWSLWDFLMHPIEEIRRLVRCVSYTRSVQAADHAGAVHAKALLVAWLLVLVAW